MGIHTHTHTHTCSHIHTRTNSPTLQYLRINKQNAYTFPYVQTDGRTLKHTHTHTTRTHSHTLTRTGGATHSYAHIHLSPPPSFCYGEIRLPRNREILSACEFITLMKRLNYFRKTISLIRTVFIVDINDPVFLL